MPSTEALEDTNEYDSCITPETDVLTAEGIPRFLLQSRVRQLRDRIVQEDMAREVMEQRAALLRARTVDAEALILVLEAAIVKLSS